jgi:deoxyribonuclease-4
LRIGAHVSIAGGLPNAVERAIERECEAIQIFNQSGRQWREQVHSDEDVAAFRDGLSEAGIGPVVIHAIYLINAASLEPELQKKSLTALANALRFGDRIGAAGVVLHPGTTKGEDYERCLKAVARTLKEALKRSDETPILLENTAGASGTLGLRFDEIARLCDDAGGGGRIGVCLDSCHLFAAGYPITEAGKLTEVLDEFDAKVGLDRLCCLHLNDSKMPFGSLRDRHENVGKGEIGRKGLATFLSEPRFEDLPVLLETPGPDERGPDRAEVRAARRLRAQGLKERAG